MPVDAALTLFWSFHISGEEADILKHWAFQWSALLKCDKMDVWAQPGGKHDPTSHLMDWQCQSWGSWATVNCWAKMLSQHFHHQNNRARFQISNWRRVVERERLRSDDVGLCPFYCQCWKCNACMFSNTEYSSASHCNDRHSHYKEQWIKVGCNYLCIFCIL